LIKALYLQCDNYLLLIQSVWRVEINLFHLSSMAITTVAHFNIIFTSICLQSSEYLENVSIWNLFQQHFTSNKARHYRLGHLILYFYLV